MEPRSEPTNMVWPFPFTPQDWEQTPLAVQAYVRILHNEVAQLHDRVETLEARLQQHSTAAHVVTNAPQSGWETGPSRPSPGALAADHSPGAAA